jgi:uncharacterized repeat protein (TIGR03803 family)
MPIRLWACRSSLAAIATLLVVVFASKNAVGQTETTIYTFGGGSDAGNPFYGLIADPSGSLYGTTYYGGFFQGGTVFQLTPHGTSWTENVLYRFVGGLDGVNANSGLARDTAGALYGVTFLGGSQNCGIVFELALSGGSWVETVVHDFTGSFNGNSPDGCLPYDNLIIDSKGVLYGTTRGGGANGGGTVYALTPTGVSWNETVVYSFSFDGRLDGSSPIAGVISDKKGNLYGTTLAGGANGFGVVFELSPPRALGGTWSETVLHQFTGGKDGGVPAAALVFDRMGRLYGTTQYGGNVRCFVESEPGCGTVFQLISQGGVWTEKVLYAFTNGKDGSEPISRLIFDDQGAIYGTATYGGTYAGGTAFRLVPPTVQQKQWNEQTVHSFAGAPDGLFPGLGALLLYKGAIYNTTQSGGTATGEGIVYRISR